MTKIQMGAVLVPGVAHPHTDVEMIFSRLASVFSAQSSVSSLFTSSSAAPFLRETMDGISFRNGVRHR